MGYRSDVRIIVSKKGYDKLCEYVKAHALEYAKPDYDYNLLNHANITYSKVCDGQQVMISWNDIKWYEWSDGYEDVSIIMNGLQYLKEEGFSYRYARLGENYDDWEETYTDGELDLADENDLQYIYLERYINDEVFE